MGGDPYAYSGPRPRPAPGAGREPATTEAAAEQGGGLEYAHYLIPRQNDVRPTPAQVASMMRAWLDAGYIAAAGSDALKRLDFKKSLWAEKAEATGATLMTNRITFDGVTVPFDEATQVKLVDRDYRVLLPVHTAWTAGLKYPLDQMPRTPRGDNGPGYNLEIHSLADYAYVTSQLIDGFPTTDIALKPVHCKVSGTNIHYVSDTLNNMFDLLGSRIHHTCPTCSTIFRPQERTVTVRDGWSGEARRLPGGATYRFAILIDCGRAVPERGPVAAVPEFKAISEAALGIPLYEVGNAY